MVRSPSSTVLYFGGMCIDTFEKSHAESQFPRTIENGSEDERIESTISAD